MGAARGSHCDPHLFCLTAFSASSCSSRTASLCLPASFRAAAITRMIYSDQNFAMPNYRRHDNLNSAPMKYCKITIPTRKLGKIEPWPLGILEATLRSSHALQVATNNRDIKPHPRNLTSCKLPIVNIDRKLPTENIEGTLNLWMRNPPTANWDIDTCLLEPDQTCHFQPARLHTECRHHSVWIEGYCISHCTPNCYSDMAIQEFSTTDLVVRLLACQLKSLTKYSTYRFRTKMEVLGLAEPHL